METLVWYCIFISVLVLCFALGFIGGRSYEAEKEHKKAFDKLTAEYEKNRAKFLQDMGEI